MKKKPMLVWIWDSPQFGAFLPGVVGKEGNLIPSHVAVF